MKKINGKSPLVGSIMLTLTAFIWGVAFVTQKMCVELNIGPFTFNGVRSLIGGCSLLPVLFIMSASRKKKMRTEGVTEQKPENKKQLFTGGIICGILLALASTLQQFGINYGTSAGKAGFLTALYIVIVPLTGIFIGKKVGIKVAIGVIFALAGLFLLSVFGEILSGTGKFMALGDIFVVICAFCFAAHILVIDHFSPLVDGVKLSCIQFFTCGCITFPLMLIFERPTFSQICVGWLPILYAGMLSCGVAYTFQVVAQKSVNPTVASLLMSFESVFAALSGWLFGIDDPMTFYELLGCVMVFIGVILAQIPGHISLLSLRKRSHT